MNAYQWLEKLKVHDTAYIKRLFLGGDPRNAETESDSDIGTELTVSGAELNLLDLSAVGAVRKIKKIPVVLAAATTFQDSGWDLPTKGWVNDVLVDVVTVEATGGTKTLDVGIKNAVESGDEDGFLDGISVATTTGIRQGSLVAAGVTLGAYFIEVVTDSAAATQNARKPYVLNGTAKSVGWTFGSNDFAELVANIYIDYVEVA